jgi:hypothetical protein
MWNKLNSVVKSVQDKLDHVIDEQFGQTEGETSEHQIHGHDETPHNPFEDHNRRESEIQFESPQKVHVSLFLSFLCDLVSTYFLFLVF